MALERLSENLLADYGEEWFSPYGVNNLSGYQTDAEIGTTVLDIRCGLVRSVDTHMSNVEKYGDVLGDQEPIVAVGIHEKNSRKGTYAPASQSARLRAFGTTACQIASRFILNVPALFEPRIGWADAILHNAPFPNLRDLLLPGLFYDDQVELFDGRVFPNLESLYIGRIHGLTLIALLKRPALRQLNVLDIEEERVLGEDPWHSAAVSILRDFYRSTGVRNVLLR
jgi:hypothetical protein